MTFGIAALSMRAADRALEIAEVIQAALELVGPHLPVTRAVHEPHRGTLAVGLATDPVMEYAAP